MTRVLLIDVQSTEIPGLDAAAVQTAVLREKALFQAEGIEADVCSVPPDRTGQELIGAALDRTHYDCVVIGIGTTAVARQLRKFYDPMDQVVLGRQPDLVLLGFNDDSPDSAVTEYLDFQRHG